MLSVSGIVAVAATIGLCAIVGIYYCWVRKLGRPEKGPQQPGKPE